MIQPRTRLESALRAGIAALSVLLAGLALPADVQRSDGEEPLTGWPPASARIEYPQPIHPPHSPVAKEAALAAQPGVRGFLRKERKWKASVDPLTGGIDRAFGDGLSVGRFESGGAIDAAARQFLRERSSLFAAGLDFSNASLEFNADGSSALPDPAARVVRLDLRQHGLPVLGAGATLALRDDRVFFVSAEALAPVTTSPSPRLSVDEAVSAVADYAQVDRGVLRALREPSLAFYPVVIPGNPSPRLGHRLIWILEVKPDGARAWEAYIAYVHAHDGSVVAFFPEAQNLSTCDPQPSQARGTVLGGVRPNRADEPEVSRPLPLVRVDANGRFVSADQNGRYPYSGGGVASSLEGDIFRMRCDSCTNPTQPAATPDGSGILDFGLGGSSQPTPVAGNGSLTPADRTTYFHLNETYRLMEKWGSARFPELEAFVNINSQCNAFSSAHMVGFFRAGGNCNNTGEIRDVIAHELGHTWDRTDGNGITSGGMSEWKGDTMAIFLGGDSCIGESFRLTGGPTSSCSGVRDVDEKSPGRVDHPATPAQCPGCFTLTRTAHNCGTGVHCLGEISGQAVWHLYNNLRNGFDYTTGLPIAGANPPFSQEQARWLMERWYVGGGAPMRTWDPTASGMSEYDAVLLADDDDGDLANGTPHAAYINAAYSHHEIAEEPLVPDSANCAALSDPLATSTLERDPLTGLPRVRLDWKPTDGSTSFDVYRNTRAGDGFLPIALNVSAGPVIDSGVATGTTYRYFVAAVRKTGCAGVSPGLGVESVTVDLPDVRVSSRTIVEAPGGGDGDGLIEPGERVRITVALREASGVAPADGVAAKLTSVEPALAPVVFAGPVDYGTIPAGGTVAGPKPFEIMIGPSIPCGATIHQVIVLSGSDGCWLESVDVEVEKIGAGCAVTAAAFVEVVPGSPAVIAGGGDADGIADNCEATTVSYRIRNAGAIASGPASSSVFTSHAGVTFSPQPSCSLTNLGAGQSQTCQFMFSLGGATAAGIPFTLTADSSANSAPSQHEFVLPAEANPPVFGTTFYNFDPKSFQGWTPYNFDLALHAASGPRSLHAGTTTAANICARATSPVLLLSPTLPATLTMQVWGDVQPITDFWYDRANVHLVDVQANEHFLLTPSAGLPYNASGNPDGRLCHVTDQNGWAGSFASWNQVSFDLSAWQGKQVRIELNYNTDEGDDRDGVYFDDISITNSTAGTLPVHAQSNSCSVPEVSAPGAVVALTAARLTGGGVASSWQDLGLGYQYNVYAVSLGSFYGHGVNALSCQGSGAAIACNGATCGLNSPGASLPGGNLYLLVTATAFGTEGTFRVRDGGTA